MVTRRRTRDIQNLALQHKRIRHGNSQVTVCCLERWLPPPSRFEPCAEGRHCADRRRLRGKTREHWGATSAIDRLPYGCNRPECNGSSTESAHCCILNATLSIRKKDDDRCANSRKWVKGSVGRIKVNRTVRSSSVSSLQLQSSGSPHRSWFLH